jgi:hypothetical protein
MASIISDLLTHTITTISSITVDGYGTKTKTTVYTDVKCRWVDKYQNVLDREGNEVVSRAEVWLHDSHKGETTTITPEYILTFGGTDYTIIAVQNNYDLLGARHHIKLFLK